MKVGYETYDDYLYDMSGEKDRREEEYDNYLCEQADLYNDELKMQEDAKFKELDQKGIIGLEN